MSVEADLLVGNAAQLLTLVAVDHLLDAEQKLGIITNGTVAIRSGRIV